MQVDQVLEEKRREMEALVKQAVVLTTAQPALVMSPSLLFLALFRSLVPSLLFSLLLYPLVYATVYLIV